MIRLLLAAFTSLALSACAIYTNPEPLTSVQVSPTPSQPEIVTTALPKISTFVPTRGEQSIYNLNESISFQVRTTQSSYLTLTAYGPDNVASVFAQGVFVEGNSVAILPTAESGVSYDLAPPRGL